jgi:glycosyltransferase involved in cell wall biosynthesis
MQRTTFSFEIIVHDDASTDTTAAIVRSIERSAPNKFNNIYQTQNQFSLDISSVTQNMFNLARGKYIALCEGDDYWTDLYKLQKQVDFLENNPDFSICWTNYKELINGGELKNNQWEYLLTGKEFHKVDFNNFCTPTYCTITLTALFRRDAIDVERLPLFKYFKDNTLYCMCLQKGFGGVLNFYGGVYRIHSGGIFSLIEKNKQAYSDFFNFSEILELIPESRVPNMYNKKKYWKSKMYSNLAEHPFAYFVRLSSAFINKVYDHLKFRYGFRE